jgi:SAM-dependent methyltransferase
LHPTCAVDFVGVSTALGAKLASLPKKAHRMHRVTTYDELPYTDHAYAEAHPDRLAVVARLSGWTAPPVGPARVLEIGCARGGNLLPMAAALPGARFVGIDASARQIEDARRIARETGLANVELHAARFEEADLGPFDYVLCHGVHSWIAADARPVLLDRIARALAPSGVAHLSFNVLPGWYARMAARDWLRATKGHDASASLAWLARQVSPENAAYRAELESVARRLAETDPAYVVHEYLATEHHPLRFRDFLGEATAAGLAYLGDAIPAETALEHLPEEVAARARALDVGGAQELVDFVTGATFRRAILVRADQARATGFAWPSALDPRALGGMRVASRLVPAGDGVFACGELRVQIGDPATERALERLAAAAPHSIPCTDLADVSGEELLDLWLATGALDLVTHEPAIADVSERPRACPVARWHAAHGGPITSRRHHEVVLTEAIVRAVLARLDGTTAIADLAPGDETLARASVVLLARSALLEA